MFFTAYMAILIVQMVRLLPGDVTFFQFMIDTMILLLQPIIDLVTSRMILFKLCFGHCVAGHDKTGQYGDENCFVCILQHYYLLSDL